MHITFQNSVYFLFLYYLQQYEQHYSLRWSFNSRVKMLQFPFCVLRLKDLPWFLLELVTKQDQLVLPPVGHPSLNVNSDTGRTNVLESFHPQVVHVQVNVNLLQTVKTLQSKNKKNCKKPFSECKEVNQQTLNTAQLSHAI